MVGVATMAVAPPSRQISERMCITGSTLAGVGSQRYGKPKEAFQVQANAAQSNAAHQTKGRHHAPQHPTRLISKSAATMSLEVADIEQALRSTAAYSASRSHGSMRPESDLDPVLRQ